MKKQLRINKKFHRNDGSKNRALRGKREVHMILKFDGEGFASSEEEYETFKTDLKEWYYDEPKKAPEKKKPGRPKKTA